MVRALSSALYCVYVLYLLTVIALESFFSGILKITVADLDPSVVPPWTVL